MDLKKVIACSPFRGGCPHRELSRFFVDSILKSVGIKTYYGTVDGDPFNRAAAKNAAVAVALDDNPDAEIVILFDSDTIISKKNILLGAEISLQKNRLVLPYEFYNCIFETDVGNVYQDKAFKPAVKYGQHVGGMVIVPVPLWHRVGGYDERFYSWGGEDRAFYFACKTLGSTTESSRIPGDAVHIWHPRKNETNPKDKGYIFCRNLGSRYKAAFGENGRSGILPAAPGPTAPDVEKMLSILREDGAPFSGLPLRTGRPCLESELALNAALFIDARNKSIVTEIGSDTYNRLKNSQRWSELNVCNA